MFRMGIQPVARSTSAAEETKIEDDLKYSASGI